MNLFLLGVGFIILGIFLCASFDWNNWWGFGFVLIGLFLMSIGDQPKDKDCVKPDQKKERTLQKPV